MDFINSWILEYYLTLYRESMSNVFSGCSLRRQEVLVFSSCRYWAWWMPFSLFPSVTAICYKMWWLRETGHIFTCKTDAQDTTVHKARRGRELSVQKGWMSNKKQSIKIDKTTQVLDSQYLFICSWQFTDMCTYGLWDIIRISVPVNEYWTIPHNVTMSSRILPHAELFLIMS